VSPIAHAAELIRSGRLVAFPTETVYGLGANALDAAAVERIFAAKGRPRTSPLIVHVDSIAMARRYSARWPEAAEKLARRYWPGPLTLVLPKAAEIPDVVTAGLPTVGLRMPNHPLALDLIREAGVPIAAPSANRFSELSPTRAEHLPARLADYVLQGGPAVVGIESAVLSLVAQPVLLRPGTIPRTEMEEMIGPIAIAAGVPPGTPHPAPGMHGRHYSPRTPLYVLKTGEAAPPGDGIRLRLGREMPENPRDYAVELYAMLHMADAQGVDWIAVEAPPEGPEWEGVRDRLFRAASERPDRE